MAILLSTTLIDLYGKEHFHEHIKEGEQFWQFFDNGTEIYKRTNKNYNLINITLVRSGVAFYQFDGHTDIKEEHFEIGSLNSRTLVPKQLELSKYADEKFIKLYKAGIYEFDKTTPIEVIIE